MATKTTIVASSKISDAGFVGTKLSDGTSPSVLSSINDSSDNTYVRKPASNSAYEAVYALSDPSPARPAAGEFVWYIQQNVRLHQGTNGYLWVGATNASGQSHIGQVVSGAYGSTKTITTYSRTAGSATVTVSTGTVAHGLSIGDAITIEGMTAGAGLNGAFTVLATGFSTTGFQYTSTATTAQSGSTGTVIKPATVTQQATYNALNPTGAYLWDQATINALRLDFIDQGTSAARARIYDISYDVYTTPLPVLAVTDVAASTPTPITAASFSRSGTTATVSFAGHGYATNDYVLVLGVGAPFDGFYQITVSSSSVFTYTVANSGLTSGSNGSIVKHVPSATVTSTTRPVLNFTYGQVDSVAQNGTQVRVFSSTKADPTDNANLVWDSGNLGNVGTVTLGAPNSTYPSGVDFTNGNYHIYVRVGASPSGLTGNRAWSSWGSGTASSYSALTVSLTPPTIPTLTATWDSTNAKVDLVASVASAFSTGSQVWSIQRSNDGGTTWYAVRGATDVNSTAAGVTPSNFSISDYEAERGTTSSGTTVRYRVKATGTLTSGGATVASAWSTATTVSTTNAGTWILRSFTDTATATPAYDLRGARVLADVTIRREEAIGVFRPLGRTTAVVVHGDLEGRDGEWTIVADTDWTTLEGILNGQRIVLVLDPFGGHRYVRVISREYTIGGGAASPRYEVSVGYVEVGSDISAGA